MIEQLELAEDRLKIFDNKKIYPNYHPLAHGHEVWADYILEKILK
jgi:hypothetical protein